MLRDVRSAAHAWFAGAPLRLAKARTLARIAWLARAEQDAICCPYCRAYPGDIGEACSREHRRVSDFDVLPKHPADLTDEERAQIDHLNDVAADAIVRMDRLTPCRTSSLHELAFEVSDAA